MTLIRVGLKATALMFATLHAQAQTYNLQDTFVGESFLGGFNWETSNDPSGGYVNYVDQGTAQQRNLTYTSGGKFVIRADDTNNVPDGSRGRDSIRITSHNMYSDSVVVFDLEHMPGGCAQWPAFWMVNPGYWPQGGEVDILEGIHTQSANRASLHTTSGCSMPPNRAEQGTEGNNDCDHSTHGNSGCVVTFPDNTFGEALNGGAGGYFAVTRSASSGIAVYFWRRDDGSVPPEIKYGSQSVSPSGSWGVPIALYPTDQCDINSHFSSHNIVINLSFCGPWASPRFGSYGCGSGTCEDFVKYNPGAFANAYWELNSLRVYTP